MKKAIDRALAAVGGRQTVLAERLGITKQAVNAWRRRGIPLRRLPDVAAATGLTVAELLPERFRDHERV